MVVTRIIPNYNRFYRNSTINISKQSMNSREQQTDLRTKDFYGFGGSKGYYFSKEEISIIHDVFNRDLLLGRWFLGGVKNH